MVKGIFHAAISTRDMDKSLWFYCEVLGARRILQVEEPKGAPLIECVQFPDGTAVEMFHPRSEIQFGTGPGRNHICFEVDNIKELEQILTDNQIEITSPPKIVRDGNWQLWCMDPNGYPVEFVETVPGCPQLSHGKLVVLN